MHNLYLKHKLYTVNIIDFASLSIILTDMRKLQLWIDSGKQIPLVSNNWTVSTGCVPTRYLNLLLLHLYASGIDIPGSTWIVLPLTLYFATMPSESALWAVPVFLEVTSVAGHLAVI